MSTPSNFQVTVIQRPALLVAGLTLRTNMEQAEKDCPEIWQTFLGRMHELTGQAPDQYRGESYGVSSMVDLPEGIFDYWATVPMDSQKPLPQGMKSITLPESLYAVCPASSLAMLPQIYTYLYMQWAPAQTNYRVDPQAPCFERYDARYFENGGFEIYVPVVAV